MKEKGITLISLIVTIIILLILAGVTLVTLTGENGIINKAYKSNRDTAEAQTREKILLAVFKNIGWFGKVDQDGLKEDLENIGATVEKENKKIYVTLNGYSFEINEYGRIKKCNYVPVTTTVPVQAVSSNTRFKDSNGDIAVIPKGFRVSEIEEEQKVKTGLVVKDNNDNEWVWIPVNDAQDMYQEIEETSLSGTTGTKTTKASKSILNDQTRSLPGTSNRREPDILTDSTRGDDDTYAKVAGFENLNDMAEEFVSDYSRMIESISDNRGFYIGRYELTGTISEPKVQAGTVLSKVNWYQYYKACKYFSGESVEGRMIWGCQWDMTCKFISECGDKKDIYNTEEWGDFGSKNTSKSLITGENSQWCANNIFDFAGNACEWTQEANYKDCRLSRGIEVNRNIFPDIPLDGDSGTTYYFKGSASSRDTYFDQRSSVIFYSTRPTLYIK